MKTIEKTIQQSERYEAPRVKVKELRRRSVITASLTMDAGTEGVTEDSGSND